MGTYLYTLRTETVCIAPPGRNHQDANVLAYEDKLSNVDPGLFSERKGTGNRIKGRLDYTWRFRAPDLVEFVVIGEAKEGATVARWNSERTDRIWGAKAWWDSSHIDVVGVLGKRHNNCYWDLIRTENIYLKDAKERAFATLRAIPPEYKQTYKAADEAYLEILRAINAHARERIQQYYEGSEIPYDLSERF